MEIYGNIIMLLMLAICAAVDIIKRQLHILLLIAFGILGMIFQILNVHQMISVGSSPDFKNLIYGICLSLVVIIASIVSRERLGMGDALLIFDCAIFMGFWGVLSLLWISCLFAGLTGFVLIFICRKSKNYRIPFVPFVFFSYVLLLVLDNFGGFV